MKNKIIDQCIEKISNKLDKRFYKTGRYDYDLKQSLIAALENLKDKADGT